MNLFPDTTILTVSRLTSLLRDVLEENFQQVWVEGEVSNFSAPSSGHFYFTLKDAGAQLRCVMFKSAAKNLKFRPKDGMAMIVRGRISLYDQRGEYQLLAEYIEPAGIGALQLAFVQLKERLSAEGLFEQLHKQPMPAFPRSVGIITSPTGAAIHDILNVLNRRFASLEILLYPVRVQGEGAALEIARAIDEMNQQALVDVLIVGRGGGSLEDLWAFNEEVVARAVYRSRIPVISAVGHETDWTICDFVADLRAPTPSAAAELVIQSAHELRSTLEQLWHRLVLSIDYQLRQLQSQQVSLKRALTDPSNMLGNLSQRVDDLSQRLDMSQERTIERLRDRCGKLDAALLHASPATTITTRTQIVATLTSSLQQLLTQQLETARTGLEIAAAQLHALSPLQTLARGYAIATAADGRVVTDATTLQPDDVLNLKLHRGTASCRVESVMPTDSKAGLPPGSDSTTAP